MTAPRSLAWTIDDPRPRPVVDALNLVCGVVPPIGQASPHLSPGRLITLVGAGGKTTLAHALADDLAVDGARVAITTTTHMAIEDSAHLDVSTALEALTGDPSTPVLVGRPAAEGKITALADADLATLKAAVDVMIVEGDGSRRLPVKVPAAHEPVVPDDTDLLLVVSGLSALGRPLAEVCCRLPEALALTGGPSSRALDPEGLATLITRGYLGHPALARWSGRTVVVLNQADTPAFNELAHEVAGLLAAPALIASTTAHRSRREPN